MISWSWILALFCDLWELKAAFTGGSEQGDRYSNKEGQRQRIFLETKSVGLKDELQVREREELECFLFQEIWELSTPLKGELSCGRIPFCKKGKNRLSVSETPGMPFPMEGCSIQTFGEDSPEIVNLHPKFQGNHRPCWGVQAFLSTPIGIWLFQTQLILWESLLTTFTPPVTLLHKLRRTLGFEAIQHLVTRLIEASQNTVTRWSRMTDANCTQSLALYQECRAFLTSWSPS